MIPPACPYCDERRPKWVNPQRKCCDSCEEWRDDDYDSGTAAEATALRRKLAEPGKAKREYDGPNDRFAT